MIDDTPQRFSAMYGTFYGRVRAYAARRVGADAADEIAADTFMVAWRRFDDVPPDPLPWLYGVARNVVLRYHAGLARQAAAREALGRERAVGGERALGPAGAAADADLFPSADGMLWAAWRELREADREALALVAWEELSVAEAARALGCSAPVFSVRLHRARRRLERLIALREASTRPVSYLSEAS